MLKIFVCGGICAAATFVGLVSTGSRARYRIVDRNDEDIPNIYIDKSIGQTLTSLAQQAGLAITGDGGRVPPWAVHNEETLLAVANLDILHAIAAHSGPVSNAALYEKVLQGSDKNAFFILSGDGPTIRQHGLANPSQDPVPGIIWEHLRKQLQMEADRAKASSCRVRADVESNGVLFGRYWCEIGSWSHPQAALLGYKVDFPKRLITAGPPCSRSDCSDIVSLSEVDLEVIVVFRGSYLIRWPPTGPFYDWFGANLQMWLTKPTGLLHTVVNSTHSGFYFRLQACWPIMEEHIRTTVKKLEDKGFKVNLRFAFAGHSQGAALATLAALAAEERFNKECMTISLFTFASPALFHSDDPDPLSSTRVRHIRFAVDSDVVIFHHGSLGQLSEWLYPRRHAGQFHITLSGAGIDAVSAHTAYHTLIKRLVGGEFALIKDEY